MKPSAALFLCLSFAFPLWAADHEDDFRRLLPNLCAVLADIGQGPFNLHEIQGLVNRGGGIYTLHPDDRMVGAPMEFDTARRYLKWLSETGTPHKLLLVPRVGWEIPAFDGVLFDIHGQPVANVNFKSAVISQRNGASDNGRQLTFAPTEVPRLVNAAAEKAKRFGKVDPWLVQSDSEYAVRWDNRRQRLMVRQSFHFLHGGGPLNLQEPPLDNDGSKLRLWRKIQFVRFATRLFAVPHSLFQRPTYLVADLGHSGFAEVDFGPEGYAPIRKILAESSDGLAEVILLNGTSTRRLQAP